MFSVFILLFLIDSILMSYFLVVQYLCISFFRSEISCIFNLSYKLDLSAPFNTVDHSILLDQLGRLGSMMSQVFACFSVSRFQKVVVVGGGRSDP